jgi:hypothetical protein
LNENLRVEMGGLLGKIRADLGTFFGIQGSQEALEGGGYNCKNFKHETTWQWIKLVLFL